MRICFSSESTVHCCKFTRLLNPVQHVLFIFYKSYLEENCVPFEMCTVMKTGTNGKYSWSCLSTLDHEIVPQSLYLRSHLCPGAMKANFRREGLGILSLPCQSQRHQPITGICDIKYHFIWACYTAIWCNISSSLRNCQWLVSLGSTR